MRYFGILTAAVMIFLAGVTTGAFAASSRDDNMLIEYPDGNYGMNLGGGYQTIPDRNSPGGQKTMLPADYRSPYTDSQYGPMTPQGLPIFPDFRFDKKKDEAKSANRKITFFMSLRPQHAGRCWAYRLRGRNNRKRTHGRERDTAEERDRLPGYHGGFALYGGRVGA